MATLLLTFPKLLTKLYIIEDQNDIRKLIADTIGLKVSDVSIIKDVNSSDISAKIKCKNDIDAIGISRIKLAQQISRLYITKQEV